MRAFADDHFIVWSPREFNTVADLAVNWTLDHDRSWEEIDHSELRHSLQKKLNIFCCVDGGRRGSGRGACGFAVYAANAGDHDRSSYRCLARVGKVLGVVESAFVAESQALELALNFLAEALEQTAITHSSN